MDVRSLQSLLNIRVLCSIDRYSLSAVHYITLLNCLTCPVMPVIKATFFWRFASAMFTKIEEKNSKQPLDSQYLGFHIRTCRLPQQNDCCCVTPRVSVFQPIKTLHFKVLGKPYFLRCATKGKR